METNTLRVSAVSSPRRLGGAIAHSLRRDNVVDLVACGAGAVNQAVKAVSVARQYLEQDDLDLFDQPEFTVMDTGDEQRTAIRFRLTLCDELGPLEKLQKVGHTPEMGTIASKRGLAADE